MQNVLTTCSCPLPRHMDFPAIYHPSSIILCVMFFSKLYFYHTKRFLTSSKTTCLYVVFLVLYFNIQVCQGKPLFLMREKEIPPPPV